jgi:hypothetical protein
VVAQVPLILVAVVAEVVVILLILRMGKQAVLELL